MAKKTRKKRDYSQMFGNPAPELPTPEEVNQKVISVTQRSKSEPPPKKNAPEKQYVAPTEEQPPTANEPSYLLTTYEITATEDEKATAENTETAAPKSNRGRKPLEVKRVPYTTSLTEEHKFQLKYHAMRRGIRPSDMLHNILEKYFRETKK